MACDQCFRLKVRCDAASPRCANCNKLQVECTYLRPDRRKISKLAVTNLVERVRLLEHTLQQHNIPIPTSIRSSKTTAISFQNLHCGSINGDTQPFSEPLMYTKENDETQLARERVLIERIDRSSSLTPGLDPEIELLVKRTGSLQFTDHGQLKYFGATSNVHFLRDTIPFQVRAPDAPPSSHEKDKSPSESSLLEYISPATPSIPRELEDHLIKLYFAWENPYFRVVDEDAFMSARRRVLSRSNQEDDLPGPFCYSEFLVNAMCSWGALFTDRELPDLPSLHDFFISQAREKLERDLDNPTIATVQGLAMMSGSEASRGRDSRGWLYAGMASQVAHHLGLHMDVGHYVRSGDITQNEATLRDTTFWGTYVIDTAWSYYLGRLVRPVVNVNRNPAQTPSQTRSTQSQYWENYTDDLADLPNYRGQYVDPVASMWKQQLKLCFIMERFQNTLYDKQTSSIGQLRMHTSAVTWALDKWMDELPSDLAVDCDSISNIYLPHVLVLHAQFHEAMIFANHPFITEPRTGNGHFGLLSLQTQKKCTESARKISQIIRMYDRLWTLRRMNIQFIHPMFTAAIVHLYVACTTSMHRLDQYKSAISDLRTCCNALRDVGKYMEIAVWQLRSIDRIRQVWYDLLENHAHGMSDAPILSEQQRLLSPSFNVDKECDRWTAIETVIQEAVSLTNTNLLLKEHMTWYDAWMQIQDTIGMDPFSVGFA
ncbi:fungal-specific transcription factor domain-containing protein [Talaromyces proteolyticus]|uniref:Fungal-specific transcription factor domain-containing protein n=1 Tax=Talaromyces proteolyticus TaxID=1131652 RepID=A0AAD4PXA2_9EURO|nr:fungal-specific transcription factor domain-containing protein [Talaromyces proteolyticus]KAH8699117.1 fungal-specific transcription factor domain-containing protein [Talaromyces proteolyticus]